MVLSVVISSPTAGHLSPTTSLVRIQPRKGDDDKTTTYYDLSERSVSCGRRLHSLDGALSIPHRCQCVVRNPEHHLRMDSHYLILLLFLFFCSIAVPS
ncbi:hypothetical protein BO71DRAFT_71885 [Aspergillus ellipticus CBS 707.79]|uniref:Uncharacterized protein n=1 Tax=Aspergillus ellipticus CBS 707.79 TaxID=1448320 RepID=A0A319DL13_9EURO|nr:hypothetical protein BO71DRAFT_71885 [Aspergillus ellipticus CBS 707.79]